MNKFLICFLIGLIIFGVALMYFVVSSYNEMYDKSLVHQENIIKNLQNYTSDDCNKLTMMNKALEENRFGQLAVEVIEDKIKEFDCLSYEEYMHGVETDER